MPARALSHKHYPATQADALTAPSGTRMLFDQDTAPEGWTRDTTTVNDRVPRVVTGARADGGSWTINGLAGTVDAHTHDLGNHTHVLNTNTTAGTYSGTADGAVRTITENDGSTVLVMELAGAGTTVLARTGTTVGPSTNTSGAASASGVTVTHTPAWRPLHRDMILCSKD